MIGGNPSRLVVDERKRAQAEARKIRMITIYASSDRYFSVFEGDLVADALGWDEMLGQIALMTIDARLGKLIGRGPYSHSVETILNRMKRRFDQFRDLRGE